jgi:hypothetical protein
MTCIFSAFYTTYACNKAFLLTNKRLTQSMCTLILQTVHSACQHCPCFREHVRFITVFLSQAKPVNTSNLVSLRFILALSSHLTLHLTFSNKNFVCISHFSDACCLSYIWYSYWSNHCNSMRWRTEIMKLFISEVSQILCYLICWRFKCHPERFVFCLCSSLALQWKTKFKTSIEVKSLTYFSFRFLGYYKDR